MSAIRALRQVRLVASSAASTRLVSNRLAGASLRLQALRSAPAPIATRSFSVSARKLGEGSTDTALASKLAEELKFETENHPEEGAPQFLTDFQALKTWSIEDGAKKDEVTLTRTFGNEELKIIFSISDLTQQQLEDEYDEAPEEGQEEGQEEESSMTPYPIRAILTITKKNVNKAVTVEMLCQEGTFIIENVSSFSDGELATALTPEAEYKRRGLYMGPSFETLDVGLQEQIEAFLHERGVDESVALFIPEYAEYKEQKEYISWLKDFKQFIEH